MATRKVKNSNDFFDILNKLKNNTFVSIGYVSGANVDMPKIKKRSPESGKLKGYPDYTPFKKEGYDQEIGALVKITSYNFRYYKKDEFDKQYSDYKAGANAIRTKHGIDPIRDKENNYSNGNSWVKNYRGDNEEKIGNTYSDQNIFDAKRKGITYIIDVNGNIIRALDDAEVKPYLKKKRDIDGVAALKKIYAEDAELQKRIEDYTNEIKSLKFRYMRFESKSILWMTATVDGEKIVYINDNLQRAVDDININPADFRQIARERYQISLNDLHESIARFNELLKENNNSKTIIRLTESDLHSIIAESVEKMLIEMAETNPVALLKIQLDKVIETFGKEMYESLDEYGEYQMRGNYELSDNVDIYCEIQCQPYAEHEEEDITKVNLRVLDLTLNDGKHEYTCQELPELEEIRIKLWQGLKNYANEWFRDYKDNIAQKETENDLRNWGGI